MIDEGKAEIDKLTDEEKTQLDAIAKELVAKQEEQSAEATSAESSPKTSSSSSAVKSGDEFTYFTVSGLGLIMTLVLDLMLNSKINRKKSDK